MYEAIKLCRRCSKIKQFNQAILLFSVAANVASKSVKSGHRDETQRDREIETGRGNEFVTTLNNYAHAARQ